MKPHPEQTIWHELLENSRRARPLTGTLLLKQDEPGDRVVMILDGQVKVYREGERKVLAFRGPHEILGRTAVLYGRPRFANVVTLQPCEVAFVPASVYKRLTTANSLREQVSQHAHERFMESTITPEGEKLDEKLAFILAHHVECSPRGVGSSAHVVLHVTRAELADQLKVGRNSVSQSLRALEQHGVVVSRKKITITNLPALRQRAGKLEI